jgi:hypothetical protein
MDADKADLRKKINRMIALGRWTQRLRKTLPLEEVIDVIDARRRRSNDEDRYALTSDLEAFLCMAGRTDEAERLIDEMIDSHPNDVRFPINKSSFYLYVVDDPERALTEIDLALDRARRTGFFHREALGVKARILLKLGRGEQLSRTLEEIMALEMKREIPDIGRERDFVDRAPAGMIEPEVLARYNAFRPRREGDY